MNATGTGTSEARVGMAPERHGLTIVRRARLVRRLVDSRKTSVILIDAPAGFGKSTVLREWERVDRRPFAWLTLGARHDDPALLTASIAGALAHLYPVDQAVYSALYGGRAGTIKVAIPRLLESLGRSQAPVVLALDDVHTLNAADALEVVDTLATGLPPGSQLALASRTRPPIHLERLRANRSLTELDASDLAMDTSEAGALLRHCGLRLHPETIEILVERTEGWPAALYLAGLSLRDAADVDGAARDFAGDDRLVADYLRDELVSVMTADELDFLSRTSVLDDVSAELCDAILETEGSATVLRALARSNALITPVDSKGRWFRYHALLREMLRSELRAVDPREEARLHARASRWYALRGDFDRAVPHAIASGRVDDAAKLIFSRTAEYAGCGRVATIEQWLGAFSEPQIAASVPLSLARAAIAIHAGDGTATEHWTGRALALLAESPESDGNAEALTARALQAAGSAREGVETMRADAVAAFELLPAMAPWRALCRFVEGSALLLVGAVEPARQTLEDGARRSAVDIPSLFALCTAQLAFLSLEVGDSQEAMQLAEAAFARTETNALGDDPAVALVVSISALVEATCGDAALASVRVKHAARLLDRLNEISAWYEAQARIMIARALSLLDDVHAARGQLAAAGKLLRHTPDAPALRTWLEHAWAQADTATVHGRWQLSPAELRLLHRLPTHLSFREIAAESHVSMNTVKTQARSVYRKLGVSSRAEAIACAQQAGLLPDD